MTRDALDHSITFGSLTRPGGFELERVLIEDEGVDIALITSADPLDLLIAEEELNSLDN